MNEGATNLVDHALPEGVTLRQWVLTLQYPLRYPLAFDAGHMGKVLWLFTTTVSGWYTRGYPGSKTGSVTVIQRTSPDLRLNRHFNTLFLNEVYRIDFQGEVSVFEPAPNPNQADIEAKFQQARKWILRYLKNKPWSRSPPHLGMARSTLRSMKPRENPHRRWHLDGGGYGGRGARVLGPTPRADTAVLKHRGRS
ncbi:MAG: hypothetical protein ABI036_18845 [Fibrobacteria bacterium]